MGRVGLAVPSRSHKNRQPEFDPRIDAQNIDLTLTLTLTLKVQGSMPFTLSEGDLQHFIAKRITNAQTRVGTFASSSTMLNRVYDAFMETYEGLTVSGMLVDCTNRERLGYGGDAHSRIEYSMDSYTSHALYSKWLTDWRDAQLVGALDDTAPADQVFGNVPNTAPTYTGAGGPMWGGITVLLPYELYRRHGDLRMLKAAYPTKPSPNPSPSPSHSPSHSPNYDRNHFRMLKAAYPTNPSPNPSPSPSHSPSPSPNYDRNPIRMLKAAYPTNPSPNPSPSPSHSPSRSPNYDRNPIRMLKAAYPAMKGFLQFMMHFAINQTDGLCRPKHFDWLGDWQAPHGCSDGTDPDLYNNAYIVYALKRAVEVVSAIDDENVAPSADALKFAAAAKSIGAAVHDTFFSKQTQRYSPTSGGAVARQGHQVLALAAGIPPRELGPIVLEALIDELTNTSRVARAHIDTGLHT